MYEAQTAQWIIGKGSIAWFLPLNKEYEINFSLKNMISIYQKYKFIFISEIALLIIINVRRYMYDIYTIFNYFYHVKSILC